MTVVTGLDIETTGLLPKKEGEPIEHKIIEINLQVFHLETRSLKANWLKRIHPGRSVLADATRVHGITLADLAGCPPFNDVVAPIQKVLYLTDFLIAHNGVYFDVPFVSHELVTLGCKPVGKPCFDTMTEGRWATAYGKSPTLGELSFACGVDYDTEKAHSAVYDVGRMMECFFKGLDWGFYKLPAMPARAAA